MEAYMTAHEIRQRLSDRNLVEVAKRLGITYSRLRRYYLGNETHLKVEEILSIAEYLRK
jgi:precorrin-6x reductase